MSDNYNSYNSNIENYNNNSDLDNLGVYKQFIILSACIYLTARLGYLSLSTFDKDNIYYEKNSNEEIIDIISIIVFISIIFIYSIRFFKSILLIDWKIFGYLVLGILFGFLFIYLDKKNDSQLNESNKNIYSYNIKQKQKQRNLFNALFLIILIIIIIYSFSINLRGIKKSLGLNYLFIILFILITSIIIYTNVQTSNVFNMNPGFVSFAALILLIPDLTQNILINNTRIILFAIFITYVSNLGIEYFIISDQEKNRLKNTCRKEFGQFVDDNLIDDNLNDNSFNDIEKKIKKDITAIKWIITLMVTSIIVIFLGVYYFVGLEFLE
jgi:hypothetical protein